MKLTELEFYVEDFLTFCQNKNLSRKTILSCDQTLRLFLAYIKNGHDVEKATEVRAGTALTPTIDKGKIDVLQTSLPLQ